MHPNNPDKRGEKIDVVVLLPCNPDTMHGLKVLNQINELQTIFVIEMQKKYLCALKN